MLGYFGKPELTAETIRGGWLYTGDGAYMDPDGFIHLVDRIKDMIITGGENVYSTEVETVLAGHPAVAMCAVIGIPHESWGEQVHAIVTLKPGCRPPPTSSWRTAGSRSAATSARAVLNSGTCFRCRQRERS